MNRLGTSETDALLGQMFAPWIRELGLQTRTIDANGADFTLADNRDLVHGGGVVCGQALVSAVDTACVLTLSALNGGFKPVTTVDMTAHFIRPVPPGEVAIRINVESNGKRMAFLRAEIRAAGQSRLAASATAAFMYIGE